MGFFPRRRKKREEQLWEKYSQLFREQNFQRALSIIEELIALDTANTEYYFRKCDTLVRLNRLEEAREILKNLKDRDEKEAAERAGLKTAHTHVMEKNWNLALYSLPPAPSRGRTWKWLAIYLRCCYELFRTDDFKQAAEKYWQEPDISALSNMEERKLASEIYTLIGSLYEDELDLGDPENAGRVKSCFGKALELDPDNEEARRSLKDFDDEVFSQQATKTDSESGHQTQDKPNRSDFKELTPLLVKPEELFAWTSAVLANLNRIQSPEFPFLLRLEMARLAACRVQPDRAAHILSSFDCPESLQAVKKEVEDWIARVSLAETDPEEDFPPLEDTRENKESTANQEQSHEELLNSLPGFDDEELFREVVKILREKPEEGSDPLSNALDDVFHGRLEKAHGRLKTGSPEQIALSMALFLKSGDQLRAHRKALRLLQETCPDWFSQPYRGFPVRLEPDKSWRLGFSKNEWPDSSHPDWLLHMIPELDKSLFASVDDIDALARIWSVLAQQNKLPGFNAVAFFVLHLLSGENSGQSRLWENFLKASGLEELFDQVKKDPFPYLSFFYDCEDEQQSAQAARLREILSEVSREDPDWEHTDLACRQLAAETGNEKPVFLIQFLKDLAAYNLGRPRDTAYLDRLVPNWQKTRQAVLKACREEEHSGTDEFTEKLSNLRKNAESLVLGLMADREALLARILDAFPVSDELKELAAREEKRFGDKAETWFDLGNALFNKNNSQEAVSCYASSLVIKPEHYTAWYNLGVALTKMGLHQKTLSCYASALAIKPDFYQALINLGNRLSEMGYNQEAISCYASALAIKPDFHDTWYNMSHELYTMGRHQEAGRCFASALVIMPDYHMRWCNLGSVLVEMGRHQEAGICFASALSIMPDCNVAWHNLGQKLYEMCRHQEAVSCYASSLVTSPNLEHVWGNLGVTLGELGSQKEAVACFALTLTINLHFDRVWDYLGDSLSEIRHDEVAMLCYKKALILDIRDPKAGRNLLSILLKTGRRQEAETLGRFLDKLHGRSLASDQAAVLYYLAAGETQAALDLITHMREQTAVLEKHGVSLVELDFLQGLALFKQEQYKASAGFLAAASTSEKLKSQSYPRLFLCYWYLDDHQRMHEVGKDWAKWMDEHIFLDDPSTFSDPDHVFAAYLKIVGNTIRLDRQQLKKWSEFLRNHDLGNTKTYNLVQDYRDMIEENLGEALVNIRDALGDLNQRLPKLQDYINQTETFEHEELVRIWHAEIMDLRKASGLTSTREEIVDEIFDLLLNTLTKVLYGSKKVDRDKIPSEYKEISDGEVLDYLQIADNLLAHDKDEKGAHFVTAVVTLCLAVELCWKKHFMSRWEKQYRQERGLVYFSVYHKLIGKALEENQDTQTAGIEREIIRFLKKADPHGKIVNEKYKKTMSRLCYKYRNNSMHINKSFNLEEARTCRKWVLQELISQGGASGNGLLPRFFQVFARNQGEGHFSPIFADKLKNHPS